MLFNQTPWQSAPIDDGYTAPVAPQTVQRMLAANFLMGNRETFRRVDPIIGQYYYGPVTSVLERVVLHRTQNPGLLPSGTL